MTNIKTNTLIAARRGLDKTSAKILHEIYCEYPKEITLGEISKKLCVVERTIKSSIKKINQYGVPIEYKINPKQTNVPCNENMVLL